MKIVSVGDLVFFCVARAAAISAGCKPLTLRDLLLGLLRAALADALGALEECAS